MRPVLAVSGKSRQFSFPIYISACHCNAYACSRLAITSHSHSVLLGVDINRLSWLCYIIEFIQAKIPAFDDNLMPQKRYHISSCHVYSLLFVDPCCDFQNSRFDVVDRAYLRITEQEYSRLPLDVSLFLKGSIFQLLQFHIFSL